MTAEELTAPFASRLTARLGRWVNELYESVRMPLLPAALMIGVPAAIAVGLWFLERAHAIININFVYYPLFVLVYAVWVIPIVGFMALSVPGIKPYRNVAPKQRFICVVPAYNERNVIGNPVLSLLAQDYPRELYDVWVIFDGTDDTAEIARSLGANVLITPTDGFGKQRALKYAFDKLLREDDDRYVCVFDADNVVSPNYLRAANNAIAEKGFRCLQCFHNVLNGPRNWITKALWCSCVAASRVYLTGRHRMPGNTLICGTGWSCEARLLRKHWGSIRTQTEDIELNGILLLEEGLTVGYVPEAHIYDEKPLNLWVSIRQRMRWMCGHSRVAYFYFWRCFVEGIKRRNVALLEIAAYYLVPFALLGSFASFALLAGLAVHVFRITGPLAWGPLQIVFGIVAFFFMFVYQVVGFFPHDISASNAFVHIRKVLLYSLYTTIFASLVWAPALIWAVFRVTKQDWLYHTPHVTDVDQSELVDQRAERFKDFVAPPSTHGLIEPAGDVVHAEPEGEAVLEGGFS
jgi:cellulose synthase/poly-beta-1,6-N-acetylglucosamine synthase-like glycosyltransferase